MGGKSKADATPLLLFLNFVILFAFLCFSLNLDKGAWPRKILKPELYFKQSRIADPDINIHYMMLAYWWWCAMGNAHESFGSWVRVNVAFVLGLKSHVTWPPKINNIILLLLGTLWGNSVIYSFLYLQHFSLFWFTDRYEPYFFFYDFLEILMQIKLSTQQYCNTSQLRSLTRWAMIKISDI